MSSLSNIVDYFKSCYLADFKAINILNFFSTKVEQQLVLETGELLNGKLLQYPVDSNWGAAMEQMLALHSQEKALYCCSFFLSGKMTVIGRSQKVFAPLYIHPVTLTQENEVYYLELDSKNAVINPVFVEFINAQSPDINITYDELDKALPKDFIRFDETHQIETALSKLIPQLDSSSIADFPKVYSSAALKTAYRKRNPSSSFSLLPAVAVGLIQKPSGSRGIINELGKMVQQDDPSNVVAELFHHNAPLAAKAPASAVLSPVTLSQAQLDVFESYDKHRLSLVIGPPGTGKSFTIAALAVDAITEGQSVLIASKNDQAGEVIAQKIEKDFGLKNVVVKANTKNFKRALYKRLNNILFGLSKRKIDVNLIKQQKKQVFKLSNDIARMEQTIIKRGEDELKWGNFFYQYKNTFLQRFKKSWIEHRIYMRNPFHFLMDNLKRTNISFNKKVKTYIQNKLRYNLYNTLQHERAEMQSLLNALKASTGNLMEEQFEKMNFDPVLHALPIWIVNSSNVHTVLPLHKELFDVVIIDEATQCDIASSLPLMQRAKKAIIVGDPKQLRHVSFLSGSQQNQLAQKHQIESIAGPKTDYRNSSLLDLASIAIPSQTQVSFLNEHYRSMPDIIDFSNQHFYDSNLNVMTATPITLKEKNVFLHQVNGQRNAKGQNQKEVEAILEMVANTIEEEKGLNKNLCQSIGILSPFRAQVNLIKSQIKTVVDTRQMKRHQVLIGTPHQFQGEERDVMLLSFVIDDQAHPSSYIYLNKHDVFNVSITRARSLQHVFTSVNIKGLNPNYLFTKFLHRAAAHPLKEQAISSYGEEDIFLEDVVKNLKRWKVDKIHKSYPIAGMEIDIVVVHKEKTYCIDLVGYPGEYTNVFPIEQYKMLDRMGVKTFTLSYSSWYLELTRSRNLLRRFIFPKGLKNS